MRVPARCVMAYDMRWQMNCCIACGGPIAPKKDVLRLDKIGSRSLLFLEEQVVRDGNEWGVAANTEVHLLSKENILHMVPETNSIPILKGFFTGRMRGLWRDSDTPGYNQAHTNTINNNDALNQRWIWIRSPSGAGGNKYRAVFWSSPVLIRHFQNLKTCLHDCLGRVNNIVRVRPNPELTVRGCKECNDIMTQESTMRHLLARDVIHIASLVPLNEIYRYNLKNGDPANAANNIQISGGRFQDPNLGNRSGIYFSFQATIAYYIHRCLDNRPAAVTPGHLNERRFHVVFGYLMLMIVSLMFERTHGTEGGTRLRSKPSYKYRGLIELYTSYIFYLLLSNDVAAGEPINGLGMQMSFPVFHKYWYGEFFQLLVHYHPNLAGFTEISDIIYTTTWYDGGNPGFAPGPAAHMAPPAVVIGYMATRIATFYTETIRPCFSRHLAGLDPLPPAGPLPAGAAGIALVNAYNMQGFAKNSLMSRQNLDVFLRLCERASPRDIDSFMNHVGIHAVVRTWREMLKTAPNKVDRLLAQWVDAWTLFEYKHILKALNSDPNQPSLPPRVGESIYLMCYMLDTPVEPVDDKDMEALMACPKCSDYKAALRLEMAGAFDTEE